MRSLSTIQRRRCQLRDTTSGTLLVVLLVVLVGSMISSSSAFVQPSSSSCCSSWISTKTTKTSLLPLFSVSPDVSAEEALARAQAHLKKLQQRGRGRLPSSGVDGAGDQEGMLHPQQQQSIRMETLYQQYILQSANSLKQELEKRKLNTKGRKPDLARRLAQFDEQRAAEAGASSAEASHGDGMVTMEEEEEDNDEEDDDDQNIDDEDVPYPVDFASIPLSFHAAAALHQAGFLEQGPSPIQAASLPAMASGESVLLHAPTGSGKTLSYVLPITEFLWRIQQYNHNSFGAGDDEPVAVICTPTRELAAQVAGVASTLAPPNSVRLLSHPSNLMTDGTKELKNRSDPKRAKPSIIVGSAKTVVTSLYGNEDFPAPPTPKPLALRFLKNVRVLVLDEVDRLLGIQGGQKHSKSNNGNTKSKKRKHEKPAAVLSAAVARHTLGKAQIVAASATVGRPLKRELARVLGLPPPKGPRVIVAQTTIAEQEVEEEQDANTRRKKKAATPQGSSRLVTIPKNVQHYLAPVAPKPQVGEEVLEGGATNADSSTSSGQLLIKAYQVIQDTMKQSNNNARILLVLARGFGISTQHVIGALQHFNCNPPPISLLDALQENALDGTDHMMQVHRQVSGATGVGQSINSEGDAEDSQQEEQQQSPSSSSSLWVTGEDTIRGLHLDGLDVVLVVGRPRGPDEYTHIAGRTGRAGKSGKVVAVISHEQAPLLRGWETMLKMKWQTYGLASESDEE